MATRSGCVYKRGNVFWIKYYRDGRPYYENSHTDVKGDAKELLQRRLGDIARGVPVTPKMNQIRVDELFEDVVKDYERNGRRSIDKVRSRIKKHLAPYFGGWRAAGVTEDNVLAFVDRRLEQKASNAEINRELAILRRGYRLAVKRHKLLTMPHIEELEENNVREGFFSRADFEAIRTLLPAPLQPLVTFAYFTGWRIRSEVQTLQWRQVDFAAGMVRLESGTTKNKRPRLFPFAAHPELQALLEDQRAATTAVEHARGCVIPWVFHRNGKQIKDFYGAWDSACETAGFPDRIPHDFRRTAVRNLDRSGVGESVAKQLTGHKTSEVYRRYDIVDEQDLVTAVEKLAAGQVVTERLQRAQIRRLRAASDRVSR